MKRVKASNLRNADHPIGIVCLLLNSHFCGFGNGAMFVLACCSQEGKLLDF